MTTTNLLRSFAVLALLLGSATAASAQAYGYEYSDGSATGYRLGLGIQYSLHSRYSHTYIGFNLRPYNGGWRLGTDGANNGGAAIYTNVGGSLAFVTVPNVGNAERDITEADFTQSIRMVLSNSGQLRVGELNPTGQFADYRLAVDGKLVAKSIYVTAPTNWADFVFAPTYRRMPLPELEAYLQRHRHLPAVPSASEVEANGYNVNDMNAKLLQSLEELTLHVIDLNKQVQQLQSELTAVKAQQTH